MPDKVVVYKGRTNVVNVSLGIDVSDDVITSEIRTESGDLIATWVVTNEGDGTDGEIILTLDDLVTAAITHSSGIMDLKRVSNDEPLPVFENPIEVEFRKVVTV